MVEKEKFCSHGQFTYEYCLKCEWADNIDKIEKQIDDVIKMFSKDYIKLEGDIIKLDLDVQRLIKRDHVEYQQKKIKIVCSGCNGKGFHLLYDMGITKSFPCKACSETGCL